jgi:hypothetical protein
MRSFLWSIVEALKSLQGGFVGSRAQKDALLRPLLILVIVLVAGPDIFALTELTTLLELLGATLFVLAYLSGFKLLGVSLLSGLRGLFLPREYLMLIGISGRPAAIAWGVVFLSAHCLILVLMTFFLTYYGVAVLTEIANS